jgi:hypothetical protein
MTWPSTAPPSFPPPRKIKWKWRKAIEEQEVKKNIMIMVFQDVSLCSLIGITRNFGGTYSFLFQGRRVNLSVGTNLNASICGDLKRRFEVFEGSEN